MKLVCCAIVALSLVAINDPAVNVPKERGIYLAGENNALTVLTQARITGMKVGGGMKAAFSYGMSKTTTKYRVRDGHAAIRTSNGQPIFYLSGADPQDLTLLKLEEKGNEREFASMTLRSINSHSEAAKGDAEFKVEKVGDAYKITFAEALKPGEYGFAYVPNGALGASMLFDFGVDTPRVASR